MNNWPDHAIWLRSSSLNSRILIQINKLINILSAPMDVPPPGHAKGHADHDFFIRGYVQNPFDPGFIESADPAGPISQLDSLERELGQCYRDIHHMPFLGGIRHRRDEIGAVLDKPLIETRRNEPLLYIRVPGKYKFPVLVVVRRRRELQGLKEDFQMFMGNRGFCILSDTEPVLNCFLNLHVKAHLSVVPFCSVGATSADPYALFGWSQQLVCRLTLVFPGGLACRPL